MVFILIRDIDISEAKGGGGGGAPIKLDKMPEPLLLVGGVHPGGGGQLGGIPGGAPGGGGGAQRREAPRGRKHMILTRSEGSEKHSGIYMENTKCAAGLDQKQYSQLQSNKKTV